LGLDSNKALLIVHGNSAFITTALSVLFLKTPQNSTIGIYSFKIYDRWGGQVFGTDSPEIGWDGNIDGVQSPAGVYFYTLRIRGSDDSLRSYNGQVQLIR
jgi:gliding motility-associated-like protein